jgi:hypothetical protein
MYCSLFDPFVITLARKFPLVLKVACIEVALLACLRCYVTYR